MKHKVILTDEQFCILQRALQECGVESLLDEDQARKFIRQTLQATNPGLLQLVPEIMKEESE